jgi:hypothetical protein
MTVLDEALRRLRDDRPASVAGPLGRGLAERGVRFVAVGGPLEQRWRQALDETAACIRPIGDDPTAILCEGGAYPGAWLESTVTINAEVLDRFAPAVTRATHRRLADLQRADGLLPYKVTDDGPGFSQIQMVTPFARSVWNHFLLTGDRDHLAAMHPVLVRADAWIAANRDTRGTGAVEAFCTFDTGHDRSPRFWLAPDRCYRGDAARYDPASPVLPYIAPDLTANVVAQRGALALIAGELGHDAAPWEERARRSRTALMEQCFDAGDRFFYDRDMTGEHVRVRSDVLLRVLACGIGDDAFFAEALERHLMSTSGFLAHYGFTSLALDDPRFDHDFRRNSWGGPANFLTMLRAPHAFEQHGRVAELALATQPVLGALALADRFPQCLDPWSGEAGYTERYSPALLWFLDAVERSVGILPRPDGELWFSTLAPTRLDHGASAEATGYARTVDGVHYELVADDDRAVLLRDGQPWLRAPRGWRIVLGPDGGVAEVVGLAGAPVEGELDIDGRTVPLRLGPNERWSADDGSVLRPGFTAPRT